MSQEPRLYQIRVGHLIVDRNRLSVIERLAAVALGHRPKVVLHKIDCPCCGKVTYHRSLATAEAKGELTSGSDTR